MITSTAIIILAAGFSKRLGEPKQMLVFNGHTLLQHTIEAAKQSGAYPVIIVTNEFLPWPTGISEGTFIIQNEAAEMGMASSIKTGMELLNTIAPLTEFVIISVCDQPYISAEIYRALSNKQAETGKPLVAAAYGGSFGTPALFHKDYFLQLLALDGDAGAKKMIQQHPDQLATIDFPQGEVDIDTSADWQRFQKRKPGLAGAFPPESPAKS